MISWVFKMYKWQAIDESNRYQQVNNSGHWDNPVSYFLDIIMGIDVPWGVENKWNCFPVSHKQIEPVITNGTCYNAAEDTLDRPMNLLPLYRMSQEECARLREGVPYIKVYRYNPKHLCKNLNGYGDNGQRSLKIWQLSYTYWLPNTY